MSIELRDFFAAHALRALLAEGGSPDEIAWRAYDLADALVRERARRGAGHDEVDLAAEAEGDDVPAWAEPPGDFERAGLLDEPAPMSERDPDLDPSWADHEFDPRWEVEPRWDDRAADAPGSDRPGLRSTRPAAPNEDKRHRSA